MIRPDQERFDRFASQVLVLDGDIERFCNANGFDLEINAHRTPCRVLRRKRRVLEIVDIYLDGDWRVIDYRECLPCVFSICSYYEASGDGRKLYKIERELAGESSFISLVPKIGVLLQESLGFFDEWSPAVVMADGVEIENTWPLNGSD